MPRGSRGKRIGDGSRGVVGSPAGLSKCVASGAEEATRFLKCRPVAVGSRRVVATPPLGDDHYEEILAIFREWQAVAKLIERNWTALEIVARKFDLLHGARGGLGERADTMRAVCSCPVAVAASESRAPPPCCCRSCQAGSLRLLAEASIDPEADASMRPFSPAEFDDFELLIARCRANGTPALPRRCSRHLVCLPDDNHPTGVADTTPAHLSPGCAPLGFAGPQPPLCNLCSRPCCFAYDRCASAGAGFAAVCTGYECVPPVAATSGADGRPRPCVVASAMASVDGAFEFAVALQLRTVDRLVGDLLTAVCDFAALRGDRLRKLTAVAEVHLNRSAHSDGAMNSDETLPHSLAQTWSGAAAGVSHSQCFAGASSRTPPGPLRSSRRTHPEGVTGTGTRAPQSVFSGEDDGTLILVAAVGPEETGRLMDRWASGRRRRRGFDDSSNAWQPFFEEADDTTNGRLPPVHGSDNDAAAAAEGGGPTAPLGCPRRLALRFVQARRQALAATVAQGVSIRSSIWGLLLVLGCLDAEAAAAPSRRAGEERAEREPTWDTAPMPKLEIGLSSTENAVDHVRKVTAALPPVKDPAPAIACITRLREMYRELPAQY
eukprot:GHVT01000669.1.p1 GENE.GHVT01000669.1~~GHVT01000669.1.p1  ORF type:complete len:607 (+),score=115.40 GHVT01000669.1:118-1938(+)